MVAGAKFYASALALAAAATATPFQAKRASSAGCGTAHTSGYNTNGGAGFALGSRTYTVRVPPNYSTTKAYPLIVDFHGRHGTSDSQHLTSQYDTFDTNGDFIVVYPQGVDQAWEGASYADPSVDDKAFVASLVQHFQDTYCIDPKRIYASGKSNGGGFVGTLACSAQGSLFAAFAMNSAALYTDNLGAGSTSRTCTPSRAAIPIIEVHGSADGTISYNGGSGAGGNTPPIATWLNTWATRNGAVDKTVHYPSPTYGSRVNLTTWHASGTSNILIEGIWIQGMDHCWASVNSNEDWSKHSACQAPLNASSIFMDFFNKWDLSGARS
ncbi:alpha/beta-hydrolase [Thozetella sp. PMI_491]|nr:alpha/beta-hydrolase [Thozetella sp. PMI_491]